jgi:hypothetical protein
MAERSNPKNLELRAGINKGAAFCCPSVVVLICSNRGEPVHLSAWRAGHHVKIGHPQIQNRLLSPEQASTIERGSANAHRGLPVQDRPH